MPDRPLSSVRSPRRWIAPAVLAALAAFLVVALSPAQPDVNTECCPCAREAAYVADLDTILERFDRQNAPVREFLRRGDVEPGPEPERIQTTRRGRRDAFLALIKCLE